METKSILSKQGNGMLLKQERSVSIKLIELIDSSHSRYLQQRLVSLALIIKLDKRSFQLPAL